MRQNHFFDWHGFKYAAKVLVLCIIAGTLGRFGLLYAAQSRMTAAPSLVLIQESHPAPARSLSLFLGTTTSQHIINTLAISDAVPTAGKFIAVDVPNMVLTLYQDGVAITKYPILATAKTGSPYETPAGFYTVLTKEPDHFSSAQQLDLPWSVQFSGNSFIHGWPYVVGGAPVDALYQGGDIRLNTDDAERVYAFAGNGVGVFVYDPLPAPPPSLTLDIVPAPSISAASYLVADIDTGDVFLEQNAGNISPITSATTLMTALVANEMVPIDKKISAANLAKLYNTISFVDWMNAKAKALDMPSTHFNDASGTSTENVSTPDDLFRLAAFLTHKKSFVLDAAVAKDATVSVYALPFNGAERHVAIIVLKSKNSTEDTIALADWFMKSAEQGANLVNTACTTCAVPSPYRKIQL
ncbi:MAG: L,D-transpeptidase family protein [bacterium]|nr:L,D-transpeptidase family protein [bacterium]